MLVIVASPFSHPKHQKLNHSGSQSIEHGMESEWKIRMEVNLILVTFTQAMHTWGKVIPESGLHRVWTPRWSLDWVTQKDSLGLKSYSSPPSFHLKGLLIICHVTKILFLSPFLHPPHYYILEKL